jgi:hypothetical protein
MKASHERYQRPLSRMFECGLALAATATLPALAQLLYPNNLVVSRSVYDNQAGNVTVSQILPPNCATTQGAGSASTGTYPYVFNNVLYDDSFGITSGIYLDQINILGVPINSIEVPNSDERGSGHHLVTSFSSKSELGLHLSTDGQFLTFMGYVAPA